uniref:Uncharacterized protein n=1 Tax=Ditylenchus dipsaci TaxID=166011 RepID=A0A915D8W3_9BILA
MVYIAQEPSQTCRMVHRRGQERRQFRHSLSKEARALTLTIRKTSFPRISEEFFEVFLEGRCDSNHIWSAKVSVTTDVLCQNGSYRLRCIDLKTSYSDVSYLSHSHMPEEVDGEIELIVGVNIKELLVGTHEERIRAEM